MQDVYKRPLYARLMAIGMASVVLALVANELGSSMGILFVGILVAVLLHGVNVVRICLAPRFKHSGYIS